MRVREMNVMRSSHVKPAVGKSIDGVSIAVECRDAPFHACLAAWQWRRHARQVVDARYAFTCEAAYARAAFGFAVHALTVSPAAIADIRDERVRFHVCASDRNVQVGDGVLFRERGKRGKRSSDDDEIALGTRRLVSCVYDAKEHEGIKRGFVILGLV